MEFLGNSLLSWTGLLGSVGMLLVSYLAKKYVIPFLQVGKRRQYAYHIATIADELTDELRLKYPGKNWVKHLDEAVDTLMAVCEIDREIARRALQAAASRK